MTIAGTIQSTIHWLGAGLSSVPGIRRLAGGAQPLVLWNRTLGRAEQAVAGLARPVETQAFRMESLAAALQAGDIVVSMLPGDWHTRIATLCLDRAAHFVSSSYISPEMSALDARAKQLGLCLVNEVGLDPGLDHLMAHALVQAYRDSKHYAPTGSVRFRSYCGGFPARPDDFYYKFSWSPLGVLKALKSPSKSIRAGAVLEVQRPWQAITRYRARLPGEREESFEAYPNRDALPFLQAYHFEPGWQVEEFVRGTLRPTGWCRAWQQIFDEIETLQGEAGETRLEEMSRQLWQEHAYGKDDPDRVVLCVELEIRQDNKLTWHQGYTMDAFGNEHGSAMARLVSLPVSLAVEAIASSRIASGVSAAPDDSLLIQEWFAVLTQLGEHIEHLDYTQS